MYLYIIKSERNNKYYIGVSSNIGKRLSQHNAGKEKSTKSYVPWVLVYFEKYDSRGEAMIRERFIKKQKSHKWIDRLIEAGSLAQR